MEQNQSQQKPVQQSGLAIASLVCGIVSFFFGILSAIPAVITGHMALSELKKKPDQFDQSSRGMAIAGLVIGYIIIALTLLVVVFFVVFAFFMASTAR